MTGEGMGRIDEDVDRAKGPREAFGAAEAADPHRAIGNRRIARAAGERKRDHDARPGREAGGKHPRLAGAAENQNSNGNAHVAF